MLLCICPSVALAADRELVAWQMQRRFTMLMKIAGLSAAPASIRHTADRSSQS